MKLELKHLAPYLPYGLKFYPSENSDLFHDLYADNFPHSTWNYALALSEKDKDAIRISNSFLKQKTPFIAIEDNELFLGQFESSIGFDVDDVFASEVKPILRPLSDLTKVIEHNGEKFVPIELFMDTFGSNDDTLFENMNDENNLLHFSICKDLPYYVIEWLLSIHFDIFGLIEQGLAIDINTLSTHP